MGPVVLGGGSSIHNMHIISSVCILLQVIQDEKVSLLLRIFKYQRLIVGLLMTICLVLHAPHGMASVDEGIVAQI